MPTSSHIIAKQSPTESTASALIVHGLNMRPSSMDSIINVLHTTGIQTTPVTLSGHREPSDDDTPTLRRERLEEFKDARRAHWHADILQALDRLDEISRCERRYFVGYSLGALLGLELIYNGQIQFDRMVLLAPAVSMHWRNNLLRCIPSRPNILLPSLMPRRIRANHGTPLSAYLELFKSCDAIRDAPSLKTLDIPTLVFIDPRDELVSANGVERWVSQAGLQHWQLESLPIGCYSLRRGCFHHLVVDPGCMGMKAWNYFTGMMIEFLSG